MDWMVKFYFMITHFIRYNPKDGTFIYPRIHNCLEKFMVYPYAESLVSPDIDADILAQQRYQY